MFGCNRVLDPPGALPQNCWKLDNDPTPRPGEIPIKVDILNVDSSSFRQLREQSLSEGRPIEELVLQIVRERGKLHNPVTGSGGMLLGTIPSGERIASLVSLTLTPLQIDEILRLEPERERIHVKGRAILFERTLYCRIPPDFSESVALSLLDVAGAPAQSARLCRHHPQQVLILGAGKAGILSAAALRRERPQARILAVDVSAANLSALHSLGLCDWSAVLDARRPLQVYEAVLNATGKALCDLTLNLVNQPDTEGASILCTRDSGQVYFFSMATSFSKAALTAEGLARDATLIIGSGYVPGWTDYVFLLLRENPSLRRYFEDRYGEQ